MNGGTGTYCNVIFVLAFFFLDKCMLGSTLPIFIETWGCYSAHTSICLKNTQNSL